MMDKLHATMSNLPGLLEVRAADHWPQVAIGGIAVMYTIVSIFMGSIWSGGHGGTVTLDDRPFAFWSCVLIYIILGCWLVLYL